MTHTESVATWCDRWKPLDRMLPSEWAEAYRELPASMTAEPGPWRNSRVPYLAGIMDATVERGVEVVTVIKAVQVGFSEALRNLIGFWVDHDPGPAMIIMPSEQAAKQTVDERLRPLLTETKVLARHVSDRREDNRLDVIRLDTMSIFMAWAGSPQALATRPVRRVLGDEVDKYPAFAGKEADPIRLAQKRLTTYGHRSLLMIGSSPTTRTGHVWRWWEDSTDRRHYFVPCPHCGHFQRLVWSGVQFPPRPEGIERKDHAEDIEAGNLAWYQCAAEECKGRIDDRHKPAMLARGEWRSETPGSSNRRIGFHLNSLYSPWVTFAKMAGEFIRAVGDSALMMDFRNSRLGEPFEEQASVTKTNIIRDKANAKAAGPPRVVPRWAGLLLASADVQLDHMYWVIRAWGHGKRSQLIAYGVVPSFDELWRTIFETPLITEDGEAVIPMALSIDCRYRKGEVYAFAQRDPARIWPVMGSAQAQSPPIAEQKVRGYQGVISRTLNPNYWKDILHGYIHDDDFTRWLPHSQIHDDYCKAMASEHKVHTREGWAWQKVSSGSPNHLWDCETAQCAIAEMCGVSALLPVVSAEPRAGTEGTKDPMRSYKGRW